MIPALLYHTIFLYVVIVLTLFQSFSINRLSYANLAKGKDTFLSALIFTFILAIWIGQRPLSMEAFGDTVVYAHTYQTMQSGVNLSNSLEGDWLWRQLMYWCAKHMDVSCFFTIVAMGYSGFLLLACKRLMPKNTYAALLFNLGALSFFSYGTNGIRNGLACSLVLFVLSLALGTRKEKIVAVFLGFCAVFIHKSTTLPIAMLVVSSFLIKSFKWAYIFWIASIAISLVAGGAMESLFTGLGFDDRLDNYIANADAYAAKGFKSGFRWDFLLYSMMPIVLGYYVVIKRGIQDKTYLLLLNTYTLSNAFWVMLIRASYSNRFAYLSWFMYPMVLAYPLFKLNIWENRQGQRVSLIMMAHISFTWIMSLV